MNLPAHLSLRAATDADLEFLRAVYFSTRAEEMAMVPWTDAEKDAFLQMQFHAQHTYYHQVYPDASYDLLLANDQPVGRLYLHRREGEIGIIDIALLPEHRGQGIGTAVLTAILAEADQVRKRVRIHVEHYNPAQHLYERLGFRRIDDVGVYYLMEWSPTPD